LKTLISLNRSTWGNVKKFATVKELSLNSAVELLLTMALDRVEDTSMSDGGNKS